MKELSKYITESILDTTMDTDVLASEFKNGEVKKEDIDRLFGPDTEEIALPEGVTELIWQVFARRDKLRRVVLPSTIKRIGEEVFKECTNLEEIVFHPKTKDLKEIGFNAFHDCNNLTKIDLPDCVEIIGSGAFSLTGITDFHVPANFKSYEGALRGMGKVKKLDLSRTRITEVSEGMFKFCRSLEEVILPRTCTSIGKEAFLNCDKLKVVRAPGIRKIGESAFHNCESLTTLDIEYDKGLSLDNFAFSNCVSLVDIPVPISTVKKYVFDGSDNIKEITWTGKGKIDMSIYQYKPTGFAIKATKKNSLRIVNVLVPKERLASWAQKNVKDFGNTMTFIFPK